MSEIKDETLKALAEAAELEKKKRELQAKEMIVKERRIDSQIETIVQNDRDLELAKNADFSSMTPEQINSIRRENVEYIQAAREKITFINSAFDLVVPFFRKNLILIGGKTGEGKSATVANVVSSVMRTENPKNGKSRRALVITNEERQSDVYNRITCLSKRKHYVNHNKFTDEDIKMFDEYIKLFAKDGWLNVIDDSYGGGHGMTTTIEGIESIFENLIKDGVFYDVILIDYYQNVKSSKKNPHLSEWQVQEKLAAMLDKYKNIYPAPIVLMAQVAPPDKDNKTPFKTRIEGRKVILNVATCCLEMLADRENLRTEWLIHKSRFNEYVGSSVKTGYDNGRFVLLTGEFIKKVEIMKEKRSAEEQDKMIGVKFEKEEKDGKE